VDVTLHEATEDDAVPVAALYRRAMPYLLQSAARLRQRIGDQRPELAGRCLVAEAGPSREVVGWGRAVLDVESREPGHGHALVLVEPARRREGIGTALLAELLAHLARSGVRTVHTNGSDGVAARGFLAARGWTPTWSSAFSRLELAGRAGGAPHGGPVVDGIVVRSLAELGDPRLLWRADVACVADVPSDVPAGELDWEHWERAIWRDASLDHELSTVATAAGEVVAYTLVQTDPEAHRIWSGMTGTVPSWRGRGLALLVKDAALRRAAERGFTQAWTGTADDNAPMAAVNRRLGYVEAARGLAAVLSLGGAGATGTSRAEGGR
jgi:GNAT superfamily N-acetyltransferase